MKKRILFVFLALVLVVSLVAFAACKAEEEPPVEEEEEAPPVEEEVPPVEEEEEVWEWPDKLSVTTVSPGIGPYEAAIAWTTPLAEDTGMKIRIVTSDSPHLTQRWLKQGMFFAAYERAHTDILEAKEAYATRDGGAFQASTLYAAVKLDSGFMVRGDSGIKTPYDLKGKKLITFTMAPVIKVMMEGLLAWGNVSPEDVEWVPAGSMDAMVRFLIDGKGDICYGGPTMPFAYEVEASPHGLAWLELDRKKDPEGAKRFADIYLMATFGIMTTGVESAHGVPGMSAVRGMSVYPDADPELVYRVVKWLDENYDKYKDAHPWCEQMTLDNLMILIETNYQVVHEGVIRYLKEKGLWTPAHEARNQHNIELLTMWEEAYQKAIDLADERGIEVNPQNEEWMELWEDYKKDLPRFKVFEGLD